MDEARAEEGHDDGHDVDRQLELQKLGDRVVHVAAPHDSLDDAAEVVVRQDDVGRLFGNVRSGDALRIYLTLGYFFFFFLFLLKREKENDDVKQKF